MILRFCLQCQACPEAYEVFYGPLYLGYLRLRHGELTFTRPGETILNGDFITDQQDGDGQFSSEERPAFLRLAADHIRNRFGLDLPEPLYEADPCEQVDWRAIYEGLRRLEAEGTRLA